MSYLTMLRLSFYYEVNVNILLQTSYRWKQKKYGKEIRK